MIKIKFKETSPYALPTIFMICLAFCSFDSLSQGVGINDDGSMPVAGTMLDVKGATDDNTTYGMQVKNNSGTAIMVVRSEGNVGIGTTTPTQKLQVNGITMSNNGFQSNNIGGTGTASYHPGGIYVAKTAAAWIYPPTIYLGDPNLGTYDQSTIIASGDLSVGTVNFKNTAGTTVGVFNRSNERFGMGTASPSARLHVYSTAGNIGSTGTSGIAISGTNSWQALALDGPTSTKSAVIHYGGSTDNAIRFGRYADNFGGWEANVTTLDMDNGNIYTQGTIEADNRIYADNGVHIRGDWLRVDGSNGIYFQSHGGGWYMSDATWIRSYGNKNVYHNTGIMRTDGTFQVGGSGGTLNVVNGGNLSYRTNVLFANTSGNVGVGTSSPSYKLDVVGTAHVDGLNINGAYSLPTSDGAANRVLKTDGAGNITWSTDSNSGGDMTAVSAGTGLTGGGSSGAVTLGITTATDDNITDRAPSSTGLGSGFYQTGSATTAEGWPENTSDWYHLINVQHSNTSNNYAMQFAGDYRDSDLFYRSTNGSGTTAWNRMWHAGSDGAGSGLDADLLDGITSGSFLRSDASDNYSGGVLRTYNDAGIDVTNTGQINGLQVYQPTANADALMTFHISGDYAVHFGLDGNTNDLTVGGWSMGGNKYKVWHAGNDGAGSGLDADLLDGISSAGFIQNQYASAQSANIWVSGETRTGGWFRNNTSGTGLYNQSTGAGIYSPSADLMSTYNDCDLQIDGASDANGNLRFTAANPYIKASSYVIVPGGAYFNSGTTYFQSQAQFRGGIHNDAAAYLTIAGGTSAISYFTGNVGIGVTAPNYPLEVNGEIVSRGGTSHFRLRHFGYSVLHRNDNTNYHMMVTNNGDPDGIWNSLRPLKIALATGDVHLGNHTLSVIHGAGVSNGSVGIGTLGPTAQFHTTGSVRFENFGAGTLQTDASGNVSVSSDAKLKNIKGDFLKGLDAVMGLTPKRYKWNNLSGLDIKEEYTGFIAQNVHDFIPEAVGKDSRGYLTLSDRPIIAVLVNAIKEQQEMIDDLKSENKSIKLENSTLKTENKLIRDDIKIIYQYLDIETKKH